MKTARKTYLLAGLVCAGLLWAGVAAFGQPDPLPQVQQEFPRSEPDDPTADAIGPSDTDTPTQAGEPAPARGTTLSIPGLVPGAGEPVPARGTTLQIQLPLNIGADGLLKDLDAPGVTLRELQQADQQLELRINRLIELYTRAIRGEATKFFMDPSLELQFSREPGGAATEGVPDPSQIREAIVVLVNKQFQIRQAMRKMEISSLEERVQRLNDLIAKAGRGTGEDRRLPIEPTAERGRGAGLGQPCRQRCEFLRPPGVPNRDSRRSGPHARFHAGDAATNPRAQDRTGDCRAGRRGTAAS